MIPPMVTLAGSPWNVLPPGVHKAGLDDIEVAFATNSRRRELFAGLVEAARRLRFAACSALYLDGSFVTAKPLPADFDACWDPNGVDRSKLDPVFLEFADGRAAQKAAFKGEFFPSSMICADVGQTFLNFLQIDRFTGKPKGIIAISLSTDLLLLR